MADLLYLISTLVIGLYAGSLLTEAMILVPYWRRMDPSEFFRLHGTLGPSLYRFFAPLTTIAVVLAVCVPILDHGQTVTWVVAAILCCLALAIFFAYFKKANDSFANHDIAEEALARELALWSAWHWLRTVLVVIAFALSIAGHMQT